MLRFVSVAFLMIFVATAQVSAHGKKDTAAAVLLAFPGGGQIYNGQPAKAVAVWGGLTLSGLFYYENGDNNDFERIAGLAALWGIWFYSLCDAAITADKINQQTRFGHLMEFDSDRTTLGIDPITSRNRFGTMLSLRF